MIKKAKFASDTRVPVEQSRNEIERTLLRYGAGSFGYISKPLAVAIVFEANQRHIRMMMPLPDPKLYEQDKYRRKRPQGAVDQDVAQANRQRWRALLLVVKAKLEAVESGVATFEQEFLPYTVLPGGKTAGEMLLPQIAEAYKTGQVPQLLLGS